MEAKNFPSKAKKVLVPAMVNAAPKQASAFESMLKVSKGRLPDKSIIKTSKGYAGISISAANALLKNALSPMEDIDRAMP